MAELGATKQTRSKMLRVEAITKWYLPPPPLLRPLVRVASPSPVQALKKVTMQVDQGEVVGLVGPNGAGKTTLIRVIATLLVPDDGTAHVHGFEVTRQPWEVRQHLGLVLEGDRGLYGRLTGRQNLEFFGVFAGLTPAMARQRADEQMRQTKLHQQDKLVFGYSSGMRARLSLARALLTNPSLLVLDEPTRSLDPVASTELGKLLRRLADQGRAVLLSSHRLDEVAAVCDRVVVLIDGEVRFAGPTRDLQEGERNGGAALGALLAREVSAG